MSIKVMNKRDYKGAGEYIGRPSVLGNPFTHLPVANTLAKFSVATRDEAVDKYRDWLREQYKANPAVRKELLRLIAIYETTSELILICWCAPLKCHGDVLKRIIEDYHVARIKAVE